MKIRIKDNSLRLRLTQGEVDHFAERRKVESTIHFPNGQSLMYCLELGDNEQFAASFDEDCITASVPKMAADKWMSPTEVGMEAKLKLPSGDELRVLIEKDFACLTEREDEDESDMFPNPNAHC